MQYTGEYRNGLMHGHGQMCWPDGSMCAMLRLPFVLRHVCNHALAVMMVNGAKAQSTAAGS